MKKRNQKDNDDYMVLFQGAKLSKLEANRVGLTAIIDIVGLLITFSVFPTGNKPIILCVAFFYSLLGYFGIATKIFKNKR